MRWVALAALAFVACASGRPTVTVPAAHPRPIAATCHVSEPTARMLRGLRHPVVLEAYVSRDTPESSAQVAELERLLRAFADASPSVAVKTLDVRTPADRARASELGVKPLTEESGRARFSGLVVTYGVERDAIPMLDMTRSVGAEFWIAGKIREVADRCDGVRHRIGVLVGHDEIGLAEANLVPAAMGKPSMREVIVRNFPTLELVDVDLHGGEVPVADDLEGLLVTQPRRDVSERELRRIDDFVMRGRALVVLASAVNVEAGDAKMTATLSTHGLERLLDGYGIEMHRDVVLDFGRAFEIAVATQSGVAKARFPALLAVEGDALDGSFPVFFRMERLVVPFASSLALHRERQPTAAMKVVARSSAHALADAHDTVDLGMHAWKPHGEWRQLDVAAYVEGRLRSAFGDGVVPDGARARVFVLASSQITANPFARAGNPPPSQTEGDPALLQIAAAYADLARGAAPLIDAIIATHNAIDLIAQDPALAAVASRAACAP